jgi:hypothetical protein
MCASASTRAHTQLSDSKPKMSSGISPIGHLHMATSCLPAVHALAVSVPGASMPRRSVPGASTPRLSAPGRGPHPSDQRGSDDWEAVVVQRESAGIHWRKSRNCGAHACVEVAAGEHGDVLMRDSKDPDGVVLRFDEETWRRFLEDIRADRFDLGPVETGGQRPSSGAPTVQ